MICEEYNKKSGLRCIYKAKTVGFDGKNVCKVHNKRKLESDIQVVIQSENKTEDVQYTKTNKSYQSDFTADSIKQFYAIHKRYVQDIISLTKETNMKIRLPCIPEYISENIIKFAIQNQGDETVYWNCKSGDLCSTLRGKLECKCFSSNGPISFTPCSEWDEIYFLDARQWLNDRYIVYRVILKYSSEEWKTIKVNKTQTFNDQCKQGRRPRLNWELLYPQISAHCTIIFDNTFSELII